MKRGFITIYVLILGVIFLGLFSALYGFVFSVWNQSARKIAFSEALNIAEAGIDYYKWCLNNDVSESCFLEREYFDKNGEPIGKFSLQVLNSVSCGKTISTQIISTGWTYKFPEIIRKIKVLYSKESVAKYSYLLNDNVWIGADHEIRGYYHSNGGIRMDGENQSLITSAQNQWICTSSFGCDVCPIGAGCYLKDSKCYCPGIFTTTNNANEDLFQYPKTPFDFGSITIDLATMKNSAQSGGIYLPPSNTINPNAKGYYLNFKNNGTVDVWVITGLSSTYSYSLEEGWHYDYFTITQKYLYRNYTIPSSCSVVFIEDNLWVDGEIKGKIAVASANLINSNIDTDIVLPGNIDYVDKNGTSGLTLIAERNILIGPQSPDKMELRGIFIAQKGRFGRNNYPNNLKEKLEIYGSVVSNGRVGTQWVSGSSIVSGYLKRETYVDNYLLYNPPVFTPSVSLQFKIYSWEEL